MPNKEVYYFTTLFNILDMGIAEYKCSHTQTLCTFIRVALELAKVCACDHCSKSKILRSSDFSSSPEPAFWNLSVFRILLLNEAQTWSTLLKGQDLASAQR